MRLSVRLIMSMSVLLTVRVGSFLSKDQMSSKNILRNPRQQRKNSRMMDGLKPETQPRLIMEYFEFLEGPVRTLSRVEDTRSPL